MGRRPVGTDSDLLEGAGGQAPLNSWEESEHEEIARVEREQHAYMDRIIDLIRKKDFDAAKSLCHEMIERYPGDNLGLDMLAEVYLESGDKSKGEAIRQKVREQDQAVFEALKDLDRAGMLFREDPGRKPGGSGRKR